MQYIAFHLCFNFGFFARCCSVYCFSMYIATFVDYSTIFPFLCLVYLASRNMLLLLQVSTYALSSYPFCSSSFEYLCSPLLLTLSLDLSVACTLYVFRHARL
ncbi:hypothetical protein L210DRAFT_379083 [Boletus edulis BED1]|uniref:Uncharacterized protein n=1 Tax=Boletus edulis BED1 TaxID=1328754 RepID=A0AAD4BQ76_BOLED|nr:hypothetical protein L210DRAFT_379083 [Boletus edulis BED1]